MADAQLTPTLRPMQVANVEGIRINSDGDGVTVVNGMTVFVPNLLPGERAVVRVVAVEKRFARAIVLSYTFAEHPEWGATASPHRVTPLCPVFELCGGCQLQHMSYEYQLQHKRQVVVDALERIGKFHDVPVEPTLGMAEPWRYRNHIQVPVQYDATLHRYSGGFFGAASHDIVVTDVCYLAPVVVENTWKDALAALSAAARRIDGDLGVHHLILRHSVATDRLMVVLVVRAFDESDATSGSLADGLRSAAAAIAALPGVATVALTVQPRVGGPVWGRSVTLLHGEEYLTERLLGLEYLISPRSFFQVNTHQSEALYRLALDAAAVQPDDTVLDAYCGAGSMTLHFARRAQAVTGIENVASAVADARRNAVHNGIANARFRLGAVENVFPLLLANGKRFDVVVLDPPRQGCDSAIFTAVGGLAPADRPRRIVYVSCNPATLARDMRRLVDAGYAIDSVQPVDMFPQTSQVECVVSLVREL